MWGNLRRYFQFGSILEKKPVPELFYIDKNVEGQ